MMTSTTEAMPEISYKHKKLLFGEPVKRQKVSLSDVVLKTSAFKQQETMTTDSLEKEANPAYKYKLTRLQTLKNIYREKMIIEYENKYKSFWDMFLMFLVIYSTLSSAYLLAFDIDTGDYPALSHWNTAVECMFVIDLILTFFQEYWDLENFRLVRNHWKIAKRYFRGWFIVDFLSVFPFQSIIDSRAFRLVRILRLLKLIKSLDGSNFNKIIESLVPMSDRQTRIKIIYATKYIYKIIRLIVIATVLTYFLGCFWYFVVSTYDFHNGEKSFFDVNHFDDDSLAKRLVTCCYFALTTLSTVGYGDLTPQSNVERIFGIAIMITGIALFSYIMGNFNEVLINYDKQMGFVNKDADLNMWIVSLNKFTPTGVLPGELVKRINEHFKYVWKNDRLSSISPDDAFFKQMPKSLQQNLITYLFDDIFTRFRSFLHTEKFKNSPFYLELAFQLLPRKYSANEYILKQGSPVQEIYLINEGSVFIYFEYEGREIGKLFEKGYFFGNYNVLSNVSAEFNFKVIKRPQKGDQTTKVYAIPKSKFLKLLEKYPAILARMNEHSKRNASSLREIMKKQLRIYLIEKLQRDPAHAEVEEIFKNCVTSKVDKSKTLFKEATRDIKKSELLPTHGGLKGTSPGDPINSGSNPTPLTGFTPGKAKDELSNEVRKAIIQDMTEVYTKMQIYKEKLLVRNKKHGNSDFYY